MSLEAVGSVVAAGPQDQLAGSDQHDLVPTLPAGRHRRTPTFDRPFDVKVAVALH